MSKIKIEFESAQPITNIKLTELRDTVLSLRDEVAEKLSELFYTKGSKDKTIAYVDNIEMR